MHSENMKLTVQQVSRLYEILANTTLN